MGAWAWACWRVQHTELTQNERCIETTPIDAPQPCGGAHLASSACSGHARDLGHPPPGLPSLPPAHGDGIFVLLATVPSAVYVAYTTVQHLELVQLIRPPAAHVAASGLREPVMGWHFNRSPRSGNEHETKEMRVAVGHGQQLKTVPSPENPSKFNEIKINVIVGNSKIAACTHPATKHWRPGKMSRSVHRSNDRRSDLVDRLYRSMWLAQIAEVVHVLHDRIEWHDSSTKHFTHFVGIHRVNATQAETGRPRHGTAKMDGGMDAWEEEHHAQLKVAKPLQYHNQFQTI
ncbi:hypothetical protein CHU98_g3428 [Xylaria longipes]|nr:hypothetical protein CHU98_g3428 [Xylaria longipes]